jgi:hypothetical protein
MPAKPNCANCAEDYVSGHRWQGTTPGAFKMRMSGVKTFYRDPATSLPPAKGAA